jgi:hypothetical protein
MCKVSTIYVYGATGARDQKNTLVEVLGLPGLKIETWGTRSQPWGIDEIAKT